MKPDATRVIILEEWQRVPVFHEYRRDHKRTRTARDDGTTLVANESRSVCGVLRYRWSWVDDGTGASKDYKSETFGIDLRRDHAQSFARPCRRCYP